MMVMMVSSMVVSHRVGCDAGGLVCLESGWRGGAPGVSESRASWMRDARKAEGEEVKEGCGM